MSFTLGHKANSIQDEYLIEIIRKLGEVIAGLGLPNPDAGILEFSASLYNHGNRSQTDDLLEEIINRLGTVSDNIGGGGGGGGGGTGTDELIKISANDTTAKYLQDALSAASEIGLEVLNEGANEQLKLLALIASANGTKARVGNIPLGEAIAKLTLRPEASQDAFQVQKADGTPKVVVDQYGNVRVLGSGINEPGGIHMVNGSKISAGNSLTGDARFEFPSNGDVRIYSGTSKMQIRDRLHFYDYARITDYQGIDVLQVPGSSNSFSVANAVNVLTGLTFMKLTATPHLAFRHNGIINLNGQGDFLGDGTVNSGSLLIQNYGENKLGIDKFGNLSYYTPQHTGFADAAAVQAAAMPVGTIAELTNGTLVRKM